MTLIYKKLSASANALKQFNNSHYYQRHSQDSKQAQLRGKAKAMEMRSNPRKRAAAMGAAAAEEGRLSGLPDDLLHAVLGRIPLKHAARTSALARRWARLWLHALAASPVLDFTDRDFVRGQSPEQIAATVDLCLLRARGLAPVDVFRVSLSASGRERDVVGWVAAALWRGAREVEVDLTTQGGVLLAAGGGAAAQALQLELPGDVFRAENLLARLSLGRCSLRDVPPGAAGLAGLTSLFLNHVDVTDDAIRDVVSQCRLLEFLSLRSCHLLTSVRVAGERLRGLELVGCLALRALEVAAPVLASFAFHGDIVFESDFCAGLDSTPQSITTMWEGTPALRDAYLSHVGFGEYSYVHEGAYCNFLHNVAHAKILTVCSVGLLHIQEEQSFFELEVYTPNLEELQVLMDSMGDDDVTRFSGFFDLTRPPLLERVFVRLPAATACGGDDDDDTGGHACGRTAAAATEDTDIVLDYEIALDHLRFIEVANFRGTRREMRLLRFLLRRAPVLEQLVVVVTPPEEEGTAGDDDDDAQQRSVSVLLEIVQEHVSAIRKAWPEARVTVCRRREDDGRSPAHTTYYHVGQA